LVNEAPNAHFVVNYEHFLLGAWSIITSLLS
jgi:hypothetical protein